MTEQIPPAPNRGHLEQTTSTEMCALTLVYYLEYEMTIHNLIQQVMVVPRYTKIADVVGARVNSLGDDEDAQVPGYHMMIIFAEREAIYQLAEALRELRRKKGHGLRGYITPVETII